MAMKSGSKGVHSEEKMLIYVGSILFQSRRALFGS